MSEDVRIGRHNAEKMKDERFAQKPDLIVVLMVDKPQLTAGAQAA